MIGLGKTVEIDESKFGAKRKYKRGRVSEGPWEFGVVEQGSQKVVVFRVPNRTRETLVQCIFLELSSTLIDSLSKYPPIS